MLDLVEIEMTIDGALGVAEVRSSRNPRHAALRESLLCAVVAALVTGAVLLLVPQAGDAAAHLYRTLLVRNGVLVWDNLWFDGQYLGARARTRVSRSLARREQPEPTVGVRVPGNTARCRPGRLQAALARRTRPRCSPGGETHT